ncbi:MAG: hypothetical protein IJ002_00085 [Clostridia bacterium]|nr:hypothetical protein [Clostridia bacterium]
MTFSMGEFKKFCKENGLALRAGLFGVSKNDSGKCDMCVDTADTHYAVKVFTVGEGAERVYFKSAGGYVTVKGTFGEKDYLWVKPDFDAKAESGKKNVGVLLLSDDIAATALAKNSATTVTAGAKAFDCVVHTPSSFVKLLTK